MTSHQSRNYVEGGGMKRATYFAVGSFVRARFSAIQRNL